MKILWMTNLRLPVIDEILGEKVDYFGGGWLTGLLDQLKRDSNRQIILCYPEYKSKDVIYGGKDNITFYGIPIDSHKNRLGALDIDAAKKIYIEVLKKEDPDVIHIHGTEFPYSNALIKAARDIGKLSNTVVSIQGMVSVYAHHFYGNLPRNTKIHRTLRECVIRDGVDDRYKSFVRRGDIERDTIAIAENVMGRTSWDYINTVSINPSIHYFKANETLRSEFYEGTWNYDHCTKHTVFVSQAGTVLKGFHKVLDAIEIVRIFYPDVMVRVSGPDITQGDNIRGNSYGQYIKKKISQSGLEDIVCFTGSLNAEKMKSEMLNANVFVSASSIENSPNSLGEAMLLGVPCVSSDVGGVADMMIHNVEGYIYPADASDMLAFYIKKVFDQRAEVGSMCQKAMEHARITHDPNKNVEDLIKIYETLAGTGV